MSENQEQRQSSTLFRVKQLRRPSRWQVILHNDDVTTMDFVIEVLMHIFGKSYETAVELMLRVHHRGKAVAGVYTKEIAETKIFQTETLAREAGFPLKLSMQREPQS